MIYKDYEIISYAMAESYNRLNDDGSWDMELNTYGDGGYPDAYAVLSPDEIIEEEQNGFDFTQLTKFDSIKQAKGYIDDLLKETN